MLDINNYNLGLKSSWIKRILYSQETKWKVLLGKIVSIEKILKTGSDYINVVKKEIKNPFWKDTFTVFQIIQEKLEVQSWDEFITQHIWNNPKIKIENKTVFYTNWFDKNIVYIADLLDENGNFYSLQDLQKKN